MGRPGACAGRAPGNLGAWPGSGGGKAHGQRGTRRGLATAAEALREVEEGPGRWGPPVSGGKRAEGASETAGARGNVVGPGSSVGPEGRRGKRRTGRQEALG